MSTPTSFGDALREPSWKLPLQSRYLLVLQGVANVFELQLVIVVEVVEDGLLTLMKLREHERERCKVFSLNCTGGRSHTVLLNAMGGRSHTVRYSINAMGGRSHNVRYSIIARNIYRERV